MLKIGAEDAQSTADNRTRLTGIPSLHAHAPLNSACNTSIPSDMAEKVAKDKVAQSKQGIMSPKRETDTVTVASAPNLGSLDADSLNQGTNKTESSLDIGIKKTEDNMDIDEAPADQPMDDAAWQENSTEQMAPSRTGRPPAASTSESTSERVLNVNDAMTYLDAIKKQFAGNQDVYNEFLNIMKDFKIQRYVIM